ncbi:MAG: dTDP-4-dehydrorhamnose reductase [Gammaproteobacteria bacterium]|nr:dTDP-4-dehydrorhamnose reductase [Gammaproteobacteria bacterium]MCW5582803.1 dTDP-4-dehydrorhamnose reductase [Gammaproteobacteria bacterium]
MKNYSPKILLTGGNGQLGLALSHHHLAKEFHVISCTKENLDITKPESIKNAITSFAPDIVINTAAYTAVDQAEKEPEHVMLVNHIGAHHLAVACNQYRVPLIHISTDYIFDGKKTQPYLEDDIPSPINLYGKSKWLGEQAVREQCKQHIILRVSGIFSEHGKNFLKTILRLIEEKNELRVIAEQITCPTYAGHIANLIYSIAKQPLQWGTYHYCDRDPVSWHQFAMAIFNEAKKYQVLQASSIKAVTVTEYPTLATRPMFSTLNCEKIENAYGIKQATWIEAMKNIIEDYYR